MQLHRNHKLLLLLLASLPSSLMPHPESAMDGDHLHFVMLPWLAMGHLLPFLELSKRLARKGHRISFLTTPRNIRRLRPNLPSDLSPFIVLVELPLPHVEHLPDSAEASIDLPSDDLRPYLRIAYDALSHHLSTFLAAAAPPPSWILYDYAAHWVPDIAARHGVPCAYLGLFSAATFGFMGSPPVLRGEGDGARTAPEHFTAVPEWVPFPTTVAYRPYEARELFKPGVLPDASGVSESYRFAAAIEGSGVVAVRSCWELEADWLRLLGGLYQKPVIPVGFFTPSAAVERDENWAATFEWLDRQEAGSVVYAAFGSEVKLREAQVGEIARGLELSGLPFVWAARAASPPREAFEKRMEGRGVVCKSWVPQVQLLAHPAVGGFLTHGGWNSVVEGLAAGTAMVLLPLMFDQGLSARLMVEKGMGVEVAREEGDGLFTGEGIAKSLRLAMVEEEGKGLREKARECKDMYGDEELQDKYVHEFVRYLSDYRRR